MKRREFLGKAVIGGLGTLWLAGPVAAAGSKAAMTPYNKVDTGLFENINRVKDPGKMTLLEKKHLPVIEAPSKVEAGKRVAVKVKMGEVTHPMSAIHYIESVQLFAGNEPAGRMEFSPLFNGPEAVFMVSLERSVTLMARSYCNLHGLWESRVEVTVV